MSEIAKCRCGAEPTVTRGISARSYVECNSLDCTGPFCTTGATAAEAIAAWNALMRPRPVAREREVMMDAKMQEVEAEIRAAVAAAQARGLVLTRGITNDGERCCLLGAFAEGPADTEDVLGPLVERWGLDETDLRELMEGFDGLYMYATDWTLLGERLAHELGAAPEPGATRYSAACNSPHSSRTIVECPVCHVLLGVAAGHGVHATCPGCLCVLATGHGGAGTETRLCAATFSRKYGTERI